MRYEDIKYKVDYLPMIGIEVDYPKVLREISMELDRLKIHIKMYDNYFEYDLLRSFNDEFTEIYYSDKEDYEEFENIYELFLNNDFYGLFSTLNKRKIEDFNDRNFFNPYNYMK